LKKPSLHPKAHALRRRWAKYLYLSIGQRVVVLPGSYVPSNNQAYIIAANHFSYLDIPTLAIGIPLFFRFVAKEDLANIPLFGIFFRTIDFAISRTNAIKSKKTMLMVDEALKKGESIVIFPEGGIKKGAPTMAKFKQGAFKTSFELNLPLLPVSIMDNYHLLGNGYIPPLHRGESRIYIHPPVHPCDFENPQQMADHMYHLIQTKINQYAH
jgi:1-acyl-sn-glycerol-3-phosphate acyltransferase